MKKYLNRVALHTATEGQGTLALGSPISAAFLTPAEAGGANGDKVSYIIEEGLDFEIGVGTLSVSGESLMRDTVTVSKIGGTASTTKMDLSGTAIVRFIAAGDDYIRHPDSVTPMSPVWFSTSAGNVLGMGEVVSPSQITVNQHDYNPTGLSTAVALRLTSDATRNITGLAGGAAQREITLLNVGGEDIVLVDASDSSTAANRFAIGRNVTLKPNTAVRLVYDGSSSRWRLIGAQKSWRGSNANGEFVRFADGTQICHHRAAAGSSINNSIGDVFRTDSTSWTYPAAFVSAPEFIPLAFSGVAYIWGAIGSNAPNTTGAAFSAFSATSSGATPTVSLVAIGRWF